MDHGTAADVRDSLHALDCVTDPHNDGDASSVFRWALVHQPGYHNGEPHYEVLLKPRPGQDSVHFPDELLNWVQDRGFYLRVDAGDLTVHVRDF